MKTYTQEEAGAWGVENMTAAEVLRKAAELCEQEGKTAGCALRRVVLESGCDAVSCCECGEEIYSKLADKIEAEIEAARSELLRQKAERWAKVNGWPEFKKGESFGEWLGRCALKRPTFDDGEPVQFGDEVELSDHDSFAAKSVLFGESGAVSITSSGNGSGYVVLPPFKRPAPKVLDADGVPIEMGDAVWIVGSTVSGEVTIIRPNGTAYVNWGDGSWSPEMLASRLTHKKPVFDADNKEIKVGDTVWEIDSDQDYEVMDFANRAAGLVQCRSLETGECEDIDADNLTHKEPDSLEKLHRDMAAFAEVGADCTSDCCRTFADRLAALIEKGGAE